MQMSIIEDEQQTSDVTLTVDLIGTLMTLSVATELAVKQMWPVGVSSPTINQVFSVILLKI